MRETCSMYTPQAVLQIPLAAVLMMPVSVAQAADEQRKPEQQKMRERCSLNQNKSNTGNSAMLLPRSPSPTMRRGVERIQAKAGHSVDLLHGTDLKDALSKKYNWVLVLKKKKLITGSKLEDDAWAVSITGDKPKQVFIEAKTGRAQLFAMYHIAECIEMKKPPAEWATRRSPLLKKRYAYISAGNAMSKVCRPDWFDSDIEDMPGLGLNGVLLILTPSHGTSIGRQTLPFTLIKGGVKVDRFKLPAFLQMFDRLKTFGLDISLFHPALIPPRFTMQAVKKHYNGKTHLSGLEEAIEKSSYDMASAIFTHMPQVDSLFCHSLECEWMWGKAVAMFPCRNETAAGGAFEAYLKGQTRACEEYGRTLMFWTHVGGISARQLRLMHKILERYPKVLVIEDHKWQNNTWPHSPVMGHLAKDICDTVTARRWGMSVVCTDGEYYGGGALPTAYPDPNVLSAETCVKLGAECAFLRFNAQALTPLRTLEDVNGIHLVAASEVWWKPARSKDVLWTDWCTRRFGAAAAPAVVSALKKSEAIILKGFSAGKQPLIDHSSLLTHSWRPGNRLNAWGVFAYPGELLVDKPWDKLTCPEIRPWQVSARGVALDDFLRDSATADGAAREALSEIESVRNNLTDQDYKYLKTCFSDALLMMEAIRLTAVAARASALCMKTKSKKNLHNLEKTCKAMEACADRIEAERGINFRPAHHIFRTSLKGRTYQAYGAPIGLRSIAEKYRKSISDK